jgi:Cof subfamily protein (haloacid dehalogenase superfamily)
MEHKKIPQLSKSASAEALRPFSKIKLIALDLDGTLLNSNKTPLPTRVKSLASSLKHRTINVHTTIATGRTLSGAKSLINDLGLSKDTPIIIYNGSVVINNNNIIFDQKFFPEVVFRNVVNAVSCFPVKLLAYCLCNTTDGIHEEAHGWSNCDMPEFDYNSMKINWHDFGTQYMGALPSAVVVHYRDVRVADEIAKTLKRIDGIVYTFGSTYIEVGPKTADKGKALKRVAKLMKLSSHQVLAMGDNHNDATMLKWAGIGVAVKNASEVAVINSDYISNYDVEKGAIEVLQLVLQAHKTVREKRKASERQANLLQFEHSGTYHDNNMQRVDNTRFHSELEIDSILDRFADSPDERDAIDSAILSGLLPKFFCKDGKPCFLSDDFFAVFQKMRLESSQVGGGLRSGTVEKICFSDLVLITNISQNAIHTPAFFPAVTNLISYADKLQEAAGGRLREIVYVGGSRLLTRSEAVSSYAEMQMERIKLAELSELDHDSRNPYYMGSKRALCGFIVEAIMPSASSDTVLVDLMCGSGVVSGAFNQFWKTYASDSQRFCRQLAIVHGGGFSEVKAEELIDFISPIAEKHFSELAERLSNFISQEMDIFCSETTPELAADYAEFIKRFPTVANGLHADGWDPQDEVNLRRKKGKFEYPYCLFTTYFANTFFGVRQSLEIDSLRYAIDQVSDGTARDWALGALVSTLSSVGTTYGGHFAQPKFKDVARLTDRQLSKLFDTRSYSVLHDFYPRLVAISKLSESRPQPVKTVDGPWKQSIDLLAQLVDAKNVLIYIDPPYTRDEYSRYYHVLETLVKYNYPTHKGNGLTPEPGDRFRSEFSKRNAKAVSETLVELITTILGRGWSCAWSYSNSAKVDIHSVIDGISQHFKCNIRSYSTPFVHKSLGKARYKDVVEYLIVISPI